MRCLFLIGLLFCGYLAPSYSQEENSLDNEPAIQGLSLQTALFLSTHAIVLNEYLTPNSEITTQAGIKNFFPHNEGVEVKTSGLYRVSFFQRVFCGNLKSQLQVFLQLTPGNYNKRYQVFTIEPNGSGDIHFSQILRVNAGQKIRLILNPTSGGINLGPNIESSGFVIEKIS